MAETDSFRIRVTVTIHGADKTSEAEPAIIFDAFGTPNPRMDRALRKGNVERQKYSDEIDHDAWQYVVAADSGVGDSLQVTALVELVLVDGTTPDRGLDKTLNPCASQNFRVKPCLADHVTGTVWIDPRPG